MFFHPKIADMKISLLLVASFFLLAIHAQVSFSQDEKIAHTFKIIGKTRGPVVSGLPGEKAVEYDPNSADHLFITDFNKDGRAQLKSHYLFLGKKFELTKVIDYVFKEQLIRDGIQIKYREDGSILNEQLFSERKLQREITYYPDGKKQLLVSVKGKIIDGEYKMWFPNGQLYYSGNYKNNFKDGEFQEYNDSGVLLRRGIYKDGKLIDGEPVVPDVTYDQPEKPAVYITGDDGFDEFLKMSSANIDGLKEIAKPRRIDLRVLIDKTGRITNVEIISEIQPNELEILNEVFKELPKFTPATEEGIPVISLKDLNFVLSADGLKRNIKDEVFAEPDEMPEFPGGSEALRHFIASNLHYPYAAQKERIQGKVFVNFIVNEDGTISKVTLARGVHYLLDEEAIRVIKSMPKWTPGERDGKPIKVSYTVPISFALR